MTRHWLRVFKTRSSAPRRASHGPRGRRPPWLEGLEERVVLSPTVYTVNSTGGSSSGMGLSGTLPYVISQANVNPNPAGSEIEFDPTVFGAPTSIGVWSTLELSETAGPEAIDGPGATVVTVNSTSGAGAFVVDSDVTATVMGLTITGYSLASNSTSSGNGGGISNNGTLTVDDCTISGCNAQANGGGIFNQGTLNVVGGMITGNSVYPWVANGGYGGGIYNSGGDLHISGGCQISNNRALYNSAGIWNDGVLSMANSTLDNNTVLGEHGAGLFDDGGTVSISGCSVSGNVAGTGEEISSGAGIFVGTGTLTMTGSKLLNNTAENTNGTTYLGVAEGGALFNSLGNVHISGCQMSGNSAQGRGGAIGNGGGTMVVDKDTIGGNRATNDGGGLYVGGGAVTIEGSTFQADSAGEDGGGIASSGALKIINSTITGNSAVSGAGIWSEAALTAVNVTIVRNHGGGRFSSGGGLDAVTGSGNPVPILENTIVALNTGFTSSVLVADDIAGTVSGSYDLIGIGGSGGLTSTNGNQVGVANPVLGTLNSNGGPTQTVALLPGSPAIGTGSDSISGVTVPTTDQRGVARPSNSIDIGAFQSQGFTYTSVDGGSGQSTTVNTAFANPLAVSVSSPAGDPVAGGVVDFVAPSSGASASLSAATATIGADGQARVTATANGIVGGYSVTALAADGATGTVFALTNSAPSSSLAATTTGLTSSLNPSTAGQSVTFTATVAPASGSGVPTGTVVFTIDGQAKPPVGLAVVNGLDQATFSTTSLSAGPHTIGAAYSGDTAFAASTVPTPLTQTALQATATQLASSANPATAGQGVTFTAIVSSLGPGTPTGTVVFTIDGQAETPVDLAVVNGQDQATFPTTTLAAGAHTISAAYSGDTAFAPSIVTTPLTETVSPAAPQSTAMQLTSSANPSPAGQGITFTAVASSTGPGTPTGTVTFTIDGQAGTPVPLSEVNGRDQATLTIPALAAGSHTIVASYSGDTAFAPSRSSQQTQIVSPTTETTTTSTSVTDGPKVVSMLRYGYHTMPTSLVLTFDQALDAVTAQDAEDYRIIGPAGRAIGIKSAVYDPATLTVTLHPVERISIHHRYELIVDGTAPDGLTNTQGQWLDGANLGHPGSDYRAPLTWRNLVLDPPWPRTSHKSGSTTVRRSPA